MGPKRGKKGTPWPEPRFADDPDIRAYVAAAIKDLEALKKHQEALEIGMPRELSTSVVDAFLYLARRVKNTPTNEQLAQRLAKVELHVEKTQKEVSQASREITTTKSNTNRLVEAICHPTSPGTRTAKNSPSFSHVTTSSESYVQAWGRKVPSNPPTVPSVGLSSGGSLPSTPYPSQEDLEVYLEHTDPNILNPIRRFPDKVVEKANLAIRSTQDTTIAHRRIAAARILPSGDIILLLGTVDDVDQLTRKKDWIRAFGNEARIQKRTWGVVVHGVNTNINPKQPQFITTLTSENAPVFAQLPASMNVTHTGWLLSEYKIKEQKLTNAHLVVIFDDERIANFAIQRGLIIKGRQHNVSIYDKAANLQQCFKCQMYKHITRHCQRQICCAYCAGSHDTGDCPTPKEKEYAKCANCTAENVHIKDPAKRLNTKHFAYARECPIRATCLAEAHQRRTYGPQYHTPVIRPGNSQPGAISPNDPTPAEAANTERSPRAPARTATTRRSANSRSKSAAAAQKRVAERSEPEPISPTSGDPTNRSSKKPMRAQWDKDLVIDADPNPEPKTGPETQIKYTYNTRARQNTKPPPGTPVLQSDIAPLEISHVQAVRTVRRSKSVRTIPDDDSSEDELTQPSIHEAPQDPIEPAQEADTLMTTNLEDSTWANNHFHILLQPTPKEEYKKRPRVCFYVNRGLDPATWEVQYHNRDLSTLTLHTAAHGTIHIHNVYNPGVNSNEESVISALQTAMAPRAQHIVLGDFNRHHPLWAGPRYRHVDEEATELINLMDEHGLEQLLPPGTITYERVNAKSTIDLVWASHNLANRVVSCDTKPEWWYGADHVPISTQFDLTAIRVPPLVRKQWNATDWDLFLKLMDIYNWHPRELNDNEAINEAIRYLVEAINQAAEQATPTKQISIYSRAGYTPEMAKLKHHVSRCRRHARRINTDQAWEDYAEARKEMKRRTNELARDLHRQRIEQATESIDGFWRIARWVRNRGKPRATFTPTLHYNNTSYTAPKEKAALFREVLHPEPPEADLSDIGPQYRYPKPYTMPPITLDEVRMAVTNVKPDKAPGQMESPIWSYKAAPYYRGLSR
ncbi:reverse transcriptase, putative [Talaromyces stipitatus ATCC 10500]|uniref:Reverse transcriptase, putative n=1 Tax=Talaromyces stipitatus (strain ATCC 10500 / CBS 375.48 / QM 6759 / NRRL 1006) TaxID=441959 RepID=B8MCU2_TALSN|nr:reverse transcriptase, putative [Talaromyces stipitatus ATCC 10500]EED18994.1 reverse transcriptase, putative [Talaromyces stipitatus ATCC 10500]